MPRETNLLDNYTHYAYDEEIDLKRTHFWIFCASDTPPGYPRPPMLDWLFMNLSNWGAGYAAEKLSIPNSKGVVFRSYHGYQYMSPIPPISDEEARQRAKAFKEAIRPLMENYSSMWSETKSKFTSYAEKAKEFNFDKATCFEMVQLLRERIEAEREMYKAFHYFGEGLGSIYILFEELCHDLLGIGESDALFQKLLAGFDNESNEVDRGLYRLSLEAEELGLREILLKNKPEEIISHVEKTGAGSKWIEELRNFLNIYGWRSSSEIDYMSPTWIEDPTQPIIYIRQYMEKGGCFELDDKIKHKAKEREEAEKEIISRIVLEQRDWFKVLMKLSQQFGVWNEEFSCYKASQEAITKYVLKQIGKRITRNGCIERPEDIFFFIPEEIYKVLFDPERCNLAPIAGRRKAAWEENKKIVPPPLLAKIGLEEAGMLLVKSRDPIALKIGMGDLAGVRSDLKANLVGRVGSPGLAEGPARVVLSPEQLGEVKSGDILVAPCVWQSWSPVFALIKGAVVDRGGVLSNAATLGREYGIPVVVNVFSGTTKIKTGQRVRVDGNTGTVHILDFLSGKKVLVVDDEADILELIEELLPMCDVVTASSFDEGKELLQTQYFDIAILDIMGVEGYKLLDIAREKKVIPVMLTAHALTVDDTVRSFRGGAAYYVPKDEMGNIEVYLNDVLEAKERGNKFWWRWLERFEPYYDKRFGPGWKSTHKEFWEKFETGK